MKKIINLSMFGLISLFSVSSFADDFLDGFFDEGIDVEIDLGISDYIGDYIASRLFVDNEALLYCTLECGDHKSAGGYVDHKPMGDYVKNSDGSYYRVLGKWLRLGKGGLDYSNQKNRVYIINQETMNTINEICQGRIGPMIDGNAELAKKIREGSIEESQCTVMPSVTVVTGKNSYKVTISD